MGESLTERHRVEDEGLLVVNSFSEGIIDEGTSGISTG